MIQIAVVLFVYFQYGLTEPPVNGYLPSSKSSLFSKNYAPSAANVSFNFGFSPRSSKTNAFRDSSSADGPQISPDINSRESLHRRREFLQNVDSRSNGVKVFKTNDHVDNAYDLKSNGTVNPSSYSSYGLPSSQYDTHTARMPYVKYGIPTEDSLPIIEENLVQRTAQDYQHKNQVAGSVIRPDFRGNQAFVSEKNHAAGNDLSRYSNGQSEETYPYEFSYEVVSPESGVSLGHHENHDGSSAEGVYHNLLPDGRLLTVEYWADEGGFKPRLSYKVLPTSDNTGY